MRKAEATCLTAMGKCSLPAEVLAPRGRRLFDPERLVAGARQRKAEAVHFFLNACYLVLKEQSFK